MKIGWVVANFFPDLVGGAEYYTWNMTRELVLHGHEVYIFTQKTKNGSQNKKTYQKNIHVHRVESFGFHYRLKVWPGLINEIKSRTLDHIIVLDYAQLYTWQVLRYAKKKGIPSSIMINDVHTYKTGRHFLKQRLLDFYDKRMAKFIFLNKADKILVRTVWTKSYLMKRYKVQSEKIEITPSGLTKEDFEVGDKKNFEKKFGLRGKIILYFGRIRKQKGALDLLKAYMIVKNIIPEAKLVYVGPDEKEHDGLSFSPILKKIVTRRKIKDVYFLGPIHGKKKNDALAAANVMCLPSSFENFGQGYSQALAQKTPVIGTRRGGIPEIISHKNDGFLINQGKTKDLARYLIKVLNNEERSKKMGEAGRRKVLKYEYQKLSKQLEKILIDS